MGGGEDFRSVEASRAALLDEIGPTPDLTFIRGAGNIGDELIWAGTRQLLDGHVYREIGLDDIGRSSGEVALFTGGAAWVRAYRYAPSALAVAEQRFERVIVLPSTFQVDEDIMRSALVRSKATFFAREEESYRAIAGLCDARRAHDCAFFYHYPHRQPSEGTLNAFRTDPERHPEAVVPAGNDDISATAANLEQWLDRIAAHTHIRTDRAHVMIAAALMGRDVAYRSCSYFKVDALAATLPPGVRARKMSSPPKRRAAPAMPRPPASPVAPARQRIEAAAARVPLAADIAPGTDGSSRVCAVILTRDRPEHVAAAVRSVLASGPGVRVLVLDANSTPSNCDALISLAAAQTRVEVRLGDRNLGCAGGRRLAVEWVEEDLVLFLDDDAELMPGALEHLVAQLDTHPEAMVVTALVVDADGTVAHFGGWPEVGGGIANFPLDGNGLDFEDPRLPPTGPTGWAPGTASLIRRQLLEEVPIDPAMVAYYEDNEWSLRVRRRHPAAFYRCAEAIALHHFAGDRVVDGPLLVHRAFAVHRLATLAHFLDAHGLLLVSELRTLVPDLIRTGEPADLDALRILLQLIAARGEEWVLARWMSGELDVLLDPTNTPHAIALAAGVRALTVERDRLTERLALTERQRDDVHELVADAELRLEALASSVARTQSSLDALRERCASTDAELTSARQRRSELEEEGERLRRQYTGAEIERELLRRRCLDGAQRIADATARQVDSDRRVAELEAQLAEQQPVAGEAEATASSGRLRRWFRPPP